MAFIAGYEGKIPGSTRKECGNYLAHNLAGAKALAKDMVDVLVDWTEDKLQYKR
jgi:S-ribosylhomocysteine lyase